MNQFRQQAEALVQQMTIEEMASMLSFEAPAIERLGISSYNWWSEALHGVARAGTATVFPQAIGLAASFDADLLREAAQAIGVEGRAKFNAFKEEGDHGIYKGLTFWSPNVNIFRDPRWGRGQETYGEDPYLAGKMGVAFVKGLQSETEDGELLAAGCAKHFAVHSGPEHERHGFDAKVTPKDLHETYLPAFEMLVREGRVEAVMGAYNRVNGEPCCGDEQLLTRILRGEWGFDGHVVSDCGAIGDFHTGHCVTDTAPESAAKALKAGCDLNCGKTYLHLLAALQEGLITEEDIRRSAVRVMTTRCRLGIAHTPSSAFDGVNPLENDTDAHDALAADMARASMVLLKNDGILPLNKQKLRTLAVIGPNADNIACLEGNYPGTSSRYVTYLDGIRQACGTDVRILYAPGSHLYKEKVTNEGVADDRLAEAVYAARHADVAVLCLGLGNALEGEEGETDRAYTSGDRAQLGLPACQQRLLQAVLATGTPCVVVLSSGSCLNVSEGNAILQAWYPGQRGGTAVTDILFGQCNPSGRMPVTGYEDAAHLPPFRDYAMQNRTYRYYHGPVLYPFGFGLSYTTFAYEAPQVTGDALTVRVTNNGSLDGHEVVQVYARRHHPMDADHPSLVGFTRVFIRAGETVTVTVPLSPFTYTVVGEDGRRISVKDVTFHVGGSQPDARSLSLMNRPCVMVRSDE